MSRPKVGFAVVGCGYMGSNAIRALLDMAKSNHLEFEPSLVALVDSDKATHHALSDVVYSLDYTVPICRDIEQSGPYLIGERALTVVYDATPPARHFSNLQYLRTLKNRQLVYLGEKPLFTDPHHVIHAQNWKTPLPVYCDSIEVSNPAVVAVRKYIRENKLKVETIRTLRASSEGVKKSIRASRPGVQGGAMLDKAPHDVAVTQSIIGTEAQPKVVESEFLVLSVAPDAFDAKAQIIFDAGGRATPYLSTRLDYRDRLPADGCSQFGVNWTLPGETIQSYHTASWIGVSSLDARLLDPFKEATRAMDLEEDKWILKGVERGPRTFQHPLSARPPDVQASVSSASSEAEFHFVADTEEARLLVVKCDTCTIVANLLGKTSSPSSPQRSAYVCLNNGTAEQFFIDESDQRKISDLQLIFESVIKHALNLPEQFAEWIHGETAFMAASVILQAQDLAVKQMSKNAATHDIDYWFKRSRAVIEPLRRSTSTIPERI